jgi:hypothetical protein
MAEDICMADIIEADIIIITDIDTDQDTIITMDTDTITVADIEHSQVDMDIIRIEANTIIVTDIKRIIITDILNMTEIINIKEKETKDTVKADHVQSLEDIDNSFRKLNYN